MTRYRKLAKKRRTRNKRSKNRRNTRKGGGRILEVGIGQGQMLSPPPQIDTSRQRRSMLTTLRQRHLAPIEPALISSRRRRRPQSAYSIPTQTIPERLPIITNKEEFIKTKNELIDILTNMMMIGEATLYNYTTGVPHIINLLQALRMKTFNINLGRDDYIVEEIDIAIQDARFWIRDHRKIFENQQNMTEQDYSELY